MLAGAEKFLGKLLTSIKQVNATISENANNPFTWFMQTVQNI